MAAVASMVESSKVRIVEKLRAEAFQRFAYDAELEAFEQELRGDLQQRGLQLSWDSARVELQEGQGIVVDRQANPGALDARSARPDPVAARPYPAIEAAVTTNVVDFPRAAAEVSPLVDVPFAAIENSSGSHNMLSVGAGDVQRPNAPTPRGGEGDDDGDDFGEDDDDLSSMTRRACASNSSALPPKRPSLSSGGDTMGSDTFTGAWHVRSQQPWQQGAEHCTLTILENGCEELIQFDLLKSKSNSKMVLTCTNAQFDDLCKEQTGLEGTAQINAAIAQLFREALEEIEKPLVGLDENDEDDFGEDHAEEWKGLAGKTESASPQPEARWHIKSQMPWQLGRENCTLTILENEAEGLVQFELVKSSSDATMHVTCTNAQFEDLLKEQGGLPGTAQTDSAIAQLFQEAVEEIDKPAYGGSGLDPVDEFGEDFGEEFSMANPAASGSGATAEARWNIKSQGPWQLGLEHCTLTILENPGEGLVQFELLKSSSDAKMYVTCTNAQFDELLKEQSGLFGAAQTNAAISQLFHEAHEEIEKPVCGSLDPVDEFGEDFGEEFAGMANNLSGAPADSEARWRIQSQQPWQLGVEHCTLTILENPGEGLVQFELLKSSTNAKMHVTCTNEQFDGLLKEQAGLTGAALMHAAITTLFQEAHEELEKPACPLDPVDEFGEDFAEEFAGMAASGAAGASPQPPQASWIIKSQSPWKMGREHCSLTILENAGEGLVQFELTKTSTNTTMHVTCTNQQFDDLLKEQSGLSGTAQNNAAIEQLFREAHEEIEKPAGGLDADEDFGEDFAEDFAAMAESKEEAWKVRSQQPWQLLRDQCTLTILENKAEGLVQFALLKLSNNPSNETMYLTCTNEQFDGLLKEQSGLTGAAQVNAAISQLFKEAHSEIQKPTRRCSDESFGMDAVEDEFQKAAAPPKAAESRWQVQSQQPWQVGKEHCMLTILENPGDGLLQFELLKMSTNTTVYVMCTDAQFDELCKEQTGLSGAAQSNAALTQMLREAHEEVQLQSE